MEIIKTWKTFILTHSILFWHKSFFWSIQKFGPTPISWTNATHAKILTHATRIIFLTHTKILQTHATYATHVKIWPTLPTLPTPPTLFSRLLKVTQKQISKLPSPVQFCFISLRSSKYFIQDWRYFLFHGITFDYGCQL